MERCGAAASSISGRRTFRKSNDRAFVPQRTQFPRVFASRTGASRWRRHRIDDAVCQPGAQPFSIGVSVKVGSTESANRPIGEAIEVVPVALSRPPPPSSSETV